MFYFYSRYFIASIIIEKRNKGNKVLNPIFEELKSVFESKEFNLKNPYMINRFLSFYPKTFKLSEECNKYNGRIPNDLLAKIYVNSIKVNKAPFIRYPGNMKLLMQKKLINNISKTFNCNIEYARQIIKIYRKIGEKPEKFYGLKPGE